MNHVHLTTAPAHVDLARRLRECPVFSSLPVPEAQRLAASARLRRFRANDYLWRLGEVAAGFALVQQGLVLVCVPRGDGAAAVFGLSGPGDCIGLAEALTSSARPADAIAVTPLVDVLWLPAAELRSRSSADSAVANAVQRALLAHIEALQSRIEIVSAGRIPARVAGLLVQLGQRFGKPQPLGRVLLKIPTSRQVLAHLVAARAESVIRVLTRWNREGVIEIGPNELLLRDLRALRAMAGC